MPVEVRLLLGFGCALLAAYLLTPVAIRVAGRFEFYDVPVGYKRHKAPTPYLGGAAVMSGFLLALSAASLAADVSHTVALAGGVAVLWAVGTTDDRRTLSPMLRVAVEAALAAGLWALGFGWDLGLGGAADLVLSMVWVVVVVNAFNLFDNMDGAAGMMGAVVAAAGAVLGLMEHDPWLAATGGALAGACVGFLPHNMAAPRARIFLGDGGSMPLGFAVAAVAMTGPSDAVAAWQALLIGMLLVGIPLLDTALVIVSRRRRGVSILTGGQDHLTYRARQRMRTTRLAVTVLGGAQMLVAALALLSVQRGAGFVVVAVLIYVIGAGITIARLEAGERRLEEAAGPAPAFTSLSGSDGGVGASVTIIALGLGAGLSPFWYGFYDAGLWVPAGMVVVVACAAALIARPPRLDVPAAVVLVASLLLALWTLASSRWAESAQQAVMGGNRALALTAVLALALSLLRGRRQALALVAAVGAGVLAVAGTVVVDLLTGTTDVFQGGRLNGPLGYVNAEGTVFVIGLWLAVALGERRRPALAGVGAALAALAGSLVLLSQSRGAAVALVIAGATVLAAVPGRRRRIALLAVVLAAVAVVSGPLRDVYASVRGSAVDEDAVTAAGRAVLGAAALAGLAWALLVHGAGRLEARGPATWERARRAAGVVLTAAAGVAIVVALALGGRIADTVGDQYHAFTHLDGPVAVQDETAQTRLLSGAGNRYDYWRIAWDVAGEHLVEGIGAGGFDVPYFERRRTTEDVRQPHSLELQVLSETGLVGTLLLVAMFAGALVAIVRAGRRAAPGDARMLVVAGAGGATAWVVHTSVDWMHLIPGVTAMALCLLAVVLREAGTEPAARAVTAPASPSAGRWRRPLALAAGVVGAVSVVLAGASLARQGLADHDRAQARAALPSDPATAARAADRALRLDADDVNAYYVKAAALARFGRGDEAVAVLQRAADREPHDFVTWALIGDLQVRLRDLDAAAAAYGRAHRLNPREPGLARLTRDPASALSR